MYNPKGYPKTKKGKAWRRLVKKYGVMRAAKMRGRRRRKYAANPTANPTANPRRRYRRNQVMPYFAFNSANPWVKGYGYKRRARRAKRIRVPRYYRRSPSARVSLPTARRRAGRPPMRLAANPLHRRSRRNAPRYYSNRRASPRRRRRTSYRRNAILPYFAFNQPLEALTAPLMDLTSPTFWLETALPVAGGALGTDIMAAQTSSLLKIRYEGIAKHGLKLSSALGLAGVVGLVTGNKNIAFNVLAGGIVSILYGVAYDIIGARTYKEVTKGYGVAGLSGLKEDLTEELKSRIAEGIKEEVGGMSQAEIPGQIPGVGMSDYLTKEQLQRAPRLSAYVTTEELQVAPHLASVDDVMSEVSA